MFASEKPYANRNRLPVINVTCPFDPSYKGIGPDNQLVRASTLGFENVIANTSPSAVLDRRWNQRETLWPLT
jgi:hypothetical protein